MSDEAQQQREVFYSGRVQGVGFRYTVRMIAGRFAVTGFVKNLPDRRVQLVVEGGPEEIDGLLRAIEAEMGRYIAASRQQTCPAGGRFSRFEIRF